MRNPLARIVGRALRHLRQIPPEVDVPSLADRLGINVNTYRRIEAGTDPMHPAYGLRFAETLAHTKVSWTRLSLVLAAVQTVHSEREDAQGIVDALRRLSTRGAALRPFLEGAVELVQLEMQIEELDRSTASKYHKRMGGKDAAVERLQTKLDERRTQLGERLAKDLTAPEEQDATSSDSGQAAALSSIVEAIERVSPVYIDVVADQLLRLGAFPPLVTPSGLLHWESSNASRFRQVFAITKNPTLLLRSAADAAVDWSYVWRNSFERMCILVIEDKSESVAAFREQLYAVLLKRAGRHRSRGRDAAAVAQLRDRVRVKAAETSPFGIQVQQETIGGLLREHSSTDSLVGFENAWFFHIRQPNYVLAYVDNANEQKPAEETMIRVLPWGEALRHLTALEAVWLDELNDARGVAEGR